MNKKVSIAVLVIAVVVIGYYAQSASPFKGGAMPDNKTYQAVFLDTNQVYFGKLANTGGAWLKLTDVYYLEQSSPTTPAPKGQPQPKFVLQKLGKVEIHGPTDQMVINRDHVLMWENLQGESAVVKKIAEEKEASK